MSTALKGRDGAFDRRIGGDHDEQGLGPKLERPVEDGDPVGTRQLNVAKHDLGLECFDLGESRGKVAGRGYLEALALEEFSQGRGDDLFVVDDQDAAAGCGSGIGVGFGIGFWHEAHSELDAGPTSSNADRFRCSI